MRRLILGALLVLVAGPVLAQQTLTLDTPESQGRPERTGWHIVEIRLGNGVVKTIDVSVEDNNGETVQCHYSGVTAASDLRVLNTANMSTVSLHRRVLTRLQGVGGPVDPDGQDTPCLGGGTVTGLPE